MKASLTAVCIFAFAGSLYAQKPVTPAPVPTPTAAVAIDASADGFSYTADGRRDPFISLIKSGTDPASPSKKNDGPSDFAVGEISVRGIMQSRAKLVAMIQGPDNHTYLIHQGDKLADGVVKNVTPQGLIVVQNITDPLSVQKQREVRKLLRSLEDSK